jgi:UDPglucose--hexose-1-phosphate uridylyltransferase
VLIAGPDHYRDLADLPVDKIAQIVQSYVDRLNFHRTNPRIKCLLLINNHGKEAGASLEHPHSQLFGIPLVPPNVQEELDGVRRHQREHGTCGYCDILAYERADGERVVFENERFLVFAPFASRTPFELMILPRWHTARFEEMTEDQRRAFAEALHQAIARITRGLNDPPFNFYIHTAPTQAASDDDYHWHLELLPKLAIAAGFELGSGVMINVATPEAAAEFLRAVDLTSQPEQTAAPGLH